MRLRFKRLVSKAAQSLPQEGGFDVAEQRADALTPERGTAIAAVTNAMESDPEARQMSSLRLVQFCWIFCGGSVVVSGYGHDIFNLRLPVRQSQSPVSSVVTWHAVCSVVPSR